jgi:hypothetical protein
VSPLRPPFPPQPGVYSRNELLLPSPAPRGTKIFPIPSALRRLSVAAGVYPFTLSGLRERLTLVDPSLKRSLKGRVILRLKTTETATLTTFRINTCKSVSKQMTLTLFRINTYRKTGEGGTPGPHTAHDDSGNAQHMRHVAAHTVRHGGGVPFPCATRCPDSAAHRGGPSETVNCKLSTVNCLPRQPGGPVRGAGRRRSAGRRSGQARRCLPSSSMHALRPSMPLLLLSSDAHRATRRGFGWSPGSSHAYSELLPRQRLSLSGGESLPLNSLPPMCLCAVACPGLVGVANPVPAVRRRVL